MNIRNSMLLASCALAAGIACTGQMGDAAAPAPGGGANTGPTSGSGQGSSQGSNSGSNLGSTSGSSVGSNAGQGGGGGGGSGAATATGTSCTSPDSSPLHARLLTPGQYDNTIQDLLQIGGQPAETNNVAGGEGAQIDPTGAGFRAQAAAAIASKASVNLASWSPCVPANTAAQAACEQQIISQIGQRAYRRPPTADETAGMKALFDGGIAAKDFATGVDWFLTGVLQTPQFLYQLIQPATTEMAGQVVPITGYEMASRLSYYMWETMPDAALMTAAANGGLNDVQGVQTQFTRMAQNQAAYTRGVTAFWYDWFDVSGYSAGLQKNLPNGMPDPAFTQDVATSLGQSILMGATSLYSSATPNLSALFQGESYYMNGTLQTYYKVGSGAGSSYVATDMPNQDRHGVLTHPAFLAANARPGVTAPILRGVFVIWNLFCLQNLQVPTNITIPALPDFQSGLTTRQLITQTHVQTACVGCHNIIDPPGFALEGFDQNGNPRTMDNGLPVNTADIVITGAGDVNGSYATADDFLAKLPNSQTVRACVAQQYLERALSGTLATQPATGDSCSVSKVGTAFAQTGDLNSLAQMVATSDSFTYRMSEGAAQ